MYAVLVLHPEAAQGAQKTHQTSKPSTSRTMANANIS